MASFPCPWCAHDLASSGSSESMDSCPSCKHDLVVAYHYRLKEFVEHDAGGKTYLAITEPLGDPVSVAFLTWPDHELARDAFHAGNRLLQHLRQFALAQVLEIAPERESHPFIVTQWLGEMTLAGRVRSGGPLGVEAVVVMLARMLEALAYIHRCLPPVVHRDIQPGKIAYPTEGEPILFGFGRAAKVGEQHTRTLVQTAEGYTAPESVEGELTPLVDLYALGRTAIYAATGAAPGASAQTVGQALAQLPAPLAQIINKLCSVDPDERYQTAVAALRHVEAFQRGAPLSQATPVGMPAPAATPSWPQPSPSPSPQWPKQVAAEDAFANFVSTQPPKSKGLWKILVIPAFVGMVTCFALFEDDDDELELFEEEIVERGAPPVRGQPLPAPPEIELGEPMPEPEPEPEPAAEPALDPREETVRSLAELIESGRGEIVDARSGLVESVDGEPPVQFGAECNIRVLKLQSGNFNCRVILICGQRVLYGSGNSGFNDCTMEGSRPIRAMDAADNDGDPAFQMDLAENRAIVLENNEDAKYRVVVALEPREGGEADEAAEPDTEPDEEPEEPSRDDYDRIDSDLAAAVRVAGRAATACGRRFKPPERRINVDLEVDIGTGKVASVDLPEHIAKTQLGKCMKRAFKRARFPQMGAGRVNIALPIVFSND